MTILSAFMDDRVVANMIISMENREERRLFVLFLFCLHFIPDIVLSQRIVFIDDQSTWREAHEHCKTLNGSLASKDDLLSVTIPQCAKDMSIVWTGNITVVTPMLSLKACVNASEEDDSKQRSQTVEQCAAWCSTSKGFEIQKHRCKCLNEEILQSEVDATHCEYKCKHDLEEQFCGGENVSNIYTFLDQDKLKNSGSTQHAQNMCAFASCQLKEQEGHYTMDVDKCVDQDLSSSTIICNKHGTTAFIGNVTNWRDACRSCVSLYRRYPVDILSSDECCPNGNCKKCNSEGRPSICFSTWTSTRKYEGRIIASDMELKDFDIMECTYVRLKPEISFVPSKICEKDSTKKVACKIYSTNIEHIPCSAPLSINPPSFSTKSAVITSVSKTSSVPTGEYISTIDTSRQERNKETSSIGIIVGVAIGTVISVAAIITVIILCRRGSCTHIQAKAQDKHSMHETRKKDMNNDVIYQATSDGEYDHLNVKRKHATETKIETDVYNHVTNTHGKENVENNYDQMSNLKDQNMTENAYYSHAKTQNPASQGDTSNEYDVTVPLQIPANKTIDVENAYDVCSKSGISQS